MEDLLQKNSASENDLAVKTVVTITVSKQDFTTITIQYNPVCIHGLSYLFVLLPLEDCNDFTMATRTDGIGKCTNRKIS